jgi:hypothetical protein
VNWGKEACKVRNKRATDAQDDDPPIDVSLDIVSQTERPRPNLFSYFLNITLTVKYRYIIQK